MRSTSISSFGTSLRHLVQGPALRETISGSVSHSACQPAKSAFVFLRHCCQHRADQPWDTHCRRQHDRRRHRISFVRHRRRSPRPFSDGSKTSATSVCECSEISFAIFPSVPTQSPKWWRPRPCGPGDCATESPATPSASSCAKVCNFATALSPSAASVPTAPPNCSTTARCCVSRNRPRWRLTASSQSATFTPNVVGNACCIHVRPTTIVERCFVASSVSPAAKRSRSLATSFRAWCNCRTQPVSIAS